MVGTLRWLIRNLPSLLLAFILALIVWVSAETTRDPNQTQQLPNPIPVEIVGLDPGLILMNPPAPVRVTFRAPGSILTRLSLEANAVRAWIDLSGLGEGRFVVEVQVQPNVRPAELVRVEPQEVQVTLESIVSQSFPVVLQTLGDVPVGYNLGKASLTPEMVTVSGARSLVGQVREVRATLDIAGKVETVEGTVPLEAVDENGAQVSGVIITPAEVAVNLPINLRGGYRNVIVRVATSGSPAPGYRITNLVVTPPNVIVFSSDPQLVNQLPGYVETKALDLTGAQDFIETELTLDLPAGITAVSDRQVLVQVSIAPIESSISIVLPVEVTGLMPGFAAEAVPPNVELVLSGPLPALNALVPTNIHVVVDVTGKGLGTYQETATVNNLPARVQVDSISADPIEVNVVIAPTPTPAPTATTTPTPTRQP